MVTADRSERARQRRLREARARNVLVSAGLLSILGGTATIYAANAHPLAQSPSVAPADATDAPVIPTATAEPTTTPTTTLEPEQEDDDTDSDDDALEHHVAPRSTVPNVTVSPTPVPTEEPAAPTPEATATPTPEIVVDQPSSHSRSHSTPG
jgi:hypothetical protein